MPSLTRKYSLSAVAVLALIAMGGLSVDAGPRKRPTGPVLSHRVDGGKAAPSGVRVENIKVWDHAGEPTLGVNPGGDVFYAAINLRGEQNGAGPSLPNQVHLFSSEDSGATWKDVSPMVGPARAHTVSLDPYVFVDELPDGDNARIFNIDLTVACSYLSFSDDKGASWTTNPLACGRPVNDHQTLFAGPPVTSSPIGYAHNVYYCWNDVGSSSCSKSIDGGITFAPTGSPAFTGYENGLCGGLHGHGVVGKDGTVYIPKEHCGVPSLAISKDEGLTWDRAIVSKKLLSIADALLDPSVAVDDKGNLYYVYVAAKDHLPYLSYSRDGGKSWSKPVMIGVPGLKEVNIPTIDAGDPGKVAIAYMGSTNVKITKDEEGNTERNRESASWNAYLAASVNVFADNPVIISAQVNESSDPVKRRNCGPGRCGAVFDFIDVVISPDGTPWAAFVDACIDVCSGPTGIADFGDEAFVGHLTRLTKLR